MLKTAFLLTALLTWGGAPASWYLAEGPQAAEGAHAAPADVLPHAYAPALAAPRKPVSAPSAFPVVEVVNAMIGVADRHGSLLTAIDPAKARAIAQAAKTGPKAPLPIPAPPVWWLLLSGIALWRAMVRRSV